MQSECSGKVLEHDYALQDEDDILSKCQHGYIVRKIHKSYKIVHKCLCKCSQQSIFCQSSNTAETCTRCLPDLGNKTIQFPSFWWKLTTFAGLLKHERMSISAKTRTTTWSNASESFGSVEFSKKASSSQKLHDHMCSERLASISNNWHSQTVLIYVLLVMNLVLRPI